MKNKINLILTVLVLSCTSEQTSIKKNIDTRSLDPVLKVYGIKTLDGDKYDFFANLTINDTFNLHSIIRSYYNIADKNQFWKIGYDTTKFQATFIVDGKKNCCDSIGIIDGANLLFQKLENDTLSILNYDDLTSSHKIVLHNIKHYIEFQPHKSPIIHKKKD